MGTLRPVLEDLDYTPPTAEQLARRKFIRDKIEDLSVRPIQDHGPITGYDIKRLRMGVGSGLVFTLAMIAVFVAVIYLRYRNPYPILPLKLNVPESLSRSATHGTGSLRPWMPAHCVQCVGSGLP